MTTYKLTEEPDFVNIAIDKRINKPNGVAGLDSNGNLIALDGQETDIKSNNNFIWEDLVHQFSAKASGGNNPVFQSVWGNFQGYVFSQSAMNQVWCDFHIRHDYAMGTNMYPHIHWCPITTDTGTVRWGIEYTVAKGHGQQAFPATTTVYVEQTITTNSNQKHMVAEVSDVNAIPGNLIEPDAVIKLRIFRDAAHANDTFPAIVHAWQVDIHYRVGQLGTRNKAPNFFT
jgi:hypothetical protein